MPLLKLVGIQPLLPIKGDRVRQELHEKLRESFLEFLVKSEAMFVSSGLSDIGDYRWQRALLTIGDYFFLSSNRRNHCYLVDSSTEAQSWRKLLRVERNKRLRGGITCTTC